MVEGGRTPLRTASELQALGYKVVIYPGAMARTIVHAAQEYLSTLHRDGTTEKVRSRMLDFDELNEVIGLNTMLEAGRRYDPEAE